MSKLFKNTAQNFAYLYQRAFVMLILAASIAAGSVSAFAATPAAGTIIGNQSSASYTDASNAPRAVTSNVVTAVVAQVAALALDTSLSKPVVAGGQVVYPITLTNLGNGTDTFSLSTVQAGFNFGSVVFYADANGDGIADNTIPITSSTALAQDGVFRFVAVGTVPTTAVNSTTNTLVITATSSFNSATSKSVTETTTVTSQAVINVSKSMSAASDSPSATPYTVYLNYSNTGNSAASNIVLTDILPVGMQYVPGSGRWSSISGTPLTEAGAVNTSSTGNTITYVGTTSPHKVVATVGSVPAGQSGVVSFQVTIAAGQIAGLLNNIASYAYYDGAATVATANTNAFGFTVAPVIAVSMTGATVTTATQGSTVVFLNVVKNNSNTTDSFDITVNNTFPPGSSYALYQPDGATPMLDTNGNSTADTGLIAPGASYTVTLKVTLPTIVTGSGPYTISKTATSKLDPSKSSTVTDTLTAISANTVNLTNNASIFTSPSTPGFATTTVGETSPQVTNTVNPGATTRFTLVVNNTTAGVPDSFDLTATSLPTGWTVVFRNAATGAIISNSGVINGTGTLVVYADVTVPANQAALPGGASILFTAKSPTSGAFDVLKDAVVVNTIRSVQLTPNNNSQVFPGGIVIYSHTLSNNGNVTETAGAIALSLTDSNTTFSSIVYYDVNGNGVIDPLLDLVVNGSTNLPSVTPGFSIGLLVKVTAPSGAPIGAIDVTNLTATTSGDINNVSPSAAVNVADTTNVIAGNLSLVKEQALDTACSGGGTFASTNIITGAIPGACIRYRITATNFGTANALNVVISDATPANTVYFATPSASFTKAGVTHGNVTTPTTLTAGTVSASAAAPLAPNEVLVLTFSVQINK